MNTTHTSTRPAIVVVSVHRGVVTDAWSNVPVSIVVEDGDTLELGKPQRFDLTPGALAEDHEAELLLQFDLTAAGPDVVSEPTISALLERGRQIAHIWGISDVQHVRDDLDDEQAWGVLQKVAKCLDSTHGITWDTIEQTAYNLFGASNHARVERCEKALAIYDDPELIDLLADAMHWCRAREQDFDALLETARMHFDAETPNK